MIARVVRVFPENQRPPIHQKGGRCSAVRAKTAVASFSEDILQRELYLPRPLCRVDLSIVRRTRGVLSVVLLSEIEDRVVEDIHRIHSELEFLPLGNRKVLGHAKVRGVIARTSKRANRTIAECTWRR